MDRDLGTLREVLMLFLTSVIENGSQESISCCRALGAVQFNETSSHSCLECRGEGEEAELLVKGDLRQYYIMADSALALLA